MMEKVVDALMLKIGNLGVGCGGLGGVDCL